MQIIDTRKTGYPVLFDTMPAVGTKRIHWREEVIEVIGYENYAARDGSERKLIIWKFPNGDIGKSGLRCKGVSRRKHETGGPGA